MSEHKGSQMDEDRGTIEGVAHEQSVGRGQPSIVVSIPGDASQTEIDALDGHLRAARPTGWAVSKEETFKTWLS